MSILNQDEHTFVIPATQYMSVTRVSVQLSITMADTRKFFKIPMRDEWFGRHNYSERRKFMDIREAEILDKFRASLNNMDSFLMCQPKCWGAALQDVMKITKFLFNISVHGNGGTVQSISLRVYRDTSKASTPLLIIMLQVPNWSEFSKIMTGFKFNHYYEHTI